MINILYFLSFKPQSLTLMRRKTCQCGDNKKQKQRNKRGGWQHKMSAAKKVNILSHSTWKWDYNWCHPLVYNKFLAISFCANNYSATFLLLQVPASFWKEEPTFSITQVRCKHEKLGWHRKECAATAISCKHHTKYKFTVQIFYIPQYLSKFTLTEKPFCSFYGAIAQT